MDETALAASYPVAPPPAAGEPSPEQRAADAVAAYLGTGKTAPAEPAAPVPPAGVKEEPPASSPEQQPEPLAPVEPYQLDVPDGTPSEIATEENIAVLNGFSAAASRAGPARPVAESLLDIYTDAQSIFRYGEPGPFSTGDEYTPEDAARVLQRFWGDDYAKNLNAVRKTVHSLPGFADWLDDSSMGNSPSTILAISMLPDLKLSKAQAEQALVAMMKDKKSDYHSSTPAKRQAAVLRAKILGRIAYAEGRLPSCLLLGLQELSPKLLGRRRASCAVG